MQLFLYVLDPFHMLNLIRSPDAWFLSITAGVAASLLWQEQSPRPFTGSSDSFTIEQIRLLVHLQDVMSLRSADAARDSPICSISVGLK